MKKGFLLLAILLIIFCDQVHAQNRIHQITLSRGFGYTLLQDELWGNQIYKGATNHYALDYAWDKGQNLNSIYLSGGSGNIAVPNSIRRRTDSFQFYLGYHHLRKVKTFDRSKISWAIGGGLASYVQFRVQNQYSSNNLASYDLATSLQLQSRFYKTVQLSDERKINFSFMVETALISAYLKPYYATSDTEEPLDAGGLNDISLRDITSRMSLVSIPSLIRLQMSGCVDYHLSHKIGLRGEYLWQVLQGKDKIKSTSASHQFNLGLFIKFGKPNEA